MHNRLLGRIKVRLEFLLMLAAAILVVAVEAGLFDPLTRWVDAQILLR